MKHCKHQTRKIFHQCNLILDPVTITTNLHLLIDLIMLNNKFTGLTHLIKDVIFINQKRPDLTSWVGGVESALNTDPLFTIKDYFNNIVFVIDSSSAVSLLRIAI